MNAAGWSEYFFSTAMSAPPTAGPATDESWNAPLFQVTARGKRSRGTRLVRNAELAGHKKAKDHRGHFRQPDEAERERRVRALVKFPADGHGEHLLADDGEQTANEVKPEVAQPEHGVVVRRRILFCCVSLVHQACRLI